MDRTFLAPEHLIIPWVRLTSSISRYVEEAVVWLEYTGVVVVVADEVISSGEENEVSEDENENIEVEISDERYEHNHIFNLKGKYFNIVAPEKYPDEIEWEYCKRCDVAVLPGELQNGYCDICYGDMHG